MPLAGAARRPSSFAWRRGIGAALLALVGTTAGAALPPDRPMLQIEGGMHTAPIQQMRLDPLRNRLVSVSTDRTARVWQLPQLQLIQTLRMPAAPGFEGELHAIAISADGRWLALGGTTGFHWRPGNGCVHVYALETLRLARSVCGWPDIVQTLAFSRDGRWLAVGLGGHLGLRVVATADWAEQPALRDPDYGGAVRYLEFSSEGKLASSAGDGYLRLYSAELKLIGRRKLGESAQLGGMRFAPDGARMAVGTGDRPQVFIVDTATLATVATRSVDDARQRDLCCIGYSVDGRQLFVNGTHDGPGATPLYRIADAGQGRIDVLPVGEQTFTNMAPLPDGSLAFATDVPTLAIVGPDGRLKTGADGRPKVVRPAVGDFRRGEAVFGASADGSVVRVPMREGGADALVFSAAALQLGEAASAGTANLAPAKREAGGAVTGTDDTPSPTWGGKRLALDPNERARAHAFSADGRALALGTLWSVRRYGADGAPRWRADVNAPVNNVLVTRDQRFAIATLSDGTVRWFDFDSGAEVAALYLHPNRRDWVLWRPDGYYASSDEGDQYVGWLVSRGAEQEPDFFSAVQFERIFYRADLAIAGLRKAPEATDPAAPRIDRIAEIAPARVHLRGRSARPLPDGTVEATIELDAERLSSPMTELLVYVNGLPVTPFAQRPLTGAQRERTQREFTVTLAEPDNVVRVEIPGAATLGLGELWVPGPPRRVAVNRPGDLYVVAAGVNHFSAFGAGTPYKSLDLSYAAADARDMAERLARNAGGVYRRVFVDLLADGTGRLPDKAGIRAALAGLQRAGPDDTVVVFLSSHGVSDRAGNYYFVPRDVRPADALAAEGGDQSGMLPSLLGWQEIFDSLRQAAGRRVLVVDTCQAGDAVAARMSHTLRKRSSSSLFALMLASRGEETSQESPALGHGVFTFGVLEALDGAAPPDAAGRITLSAAFEHARRFVADKRPIRENPQTPQLVTPSRLGEVALAQRPPRR